MHIIITIVLVLVGIIALLLVIGLFAKKEYTIVRSIVVNRTKDSVFDYIKYIHNSENYSKWVMLDPNSRRERRGTDGTVGFVYTWDSKIRNVGAGEQEIVSISEGNSIGFEIRFLRPWKGVSHATMTTEKVSDKSTKVTWTFNSAMKYPMNLITLFMNFDKMLGTDMEISLRNLKGILEKGGIE